jgi:hypothetical protein
MSDMLLEIESEPEEMQVTEKETSGGGTTL